MDGKRERRRESERVSETRRGKASRGEGEILNELERESPPVDAKAGGGRERKREGERGGKRQR